MSGRARLGSLRGRYVMKGKRGRWKGDTRTMPASPAEPGLLQLAVLAASAVVEALMHIEPVRLGLARNAPPDARQGLAPRFGDRLAALLTGEEALSVRESAPRAFDSAVDRRVDLILHGAILRPTHRHDRNIRQVRTLSRRRGSGGSARAASYAPVFVDTPARPAPHRHEAKRRARIHVGVLASCGRLSLGLL